MKKNMHKDLLNKSSKGKKEKTQEEITKENMVRSDRANKANQYISSKMQEDFIREYKCELSIDNLATLQGLRFVPMEQIKPGATHILMGLSVPLSGASLKAVGFTDEEVKTRLEQIEAEALEKEQAEVMTETQFKEQAKNV